MIIVNFVAITAIFSENGFSYGL